MFGTLTLNPFLNLNNQAPLTCEAVALHGLKSGNMLVLDALVSVSSSFPFGISIVTLGHCGLRGLGSGLFVCLFVYLQVGWLCEIFTT